MKKLLPILILGIAGAIFIVLIVLKPEPEDTLPEQPAAKVEALTVRPETVQLSVSSQGTVLPKVESDLAVEVSGRIIGMAPSFRPGGRFKADDVLFRIDPADYEANRATRAAELANAELGLAQEEALAEQAEADWTAMGEGEPSDLTLRKPQLAQARALVASAKAALKKAERDLERTEIKAPYDGLVLTKNVDLGQFVTANPASPVARVYSTKSAEVRLPLAQREVRFLNDPERTQGPVRLSSNGQVWEGRFARFEATIDPASRLIYAVAEIADPFEQGLRRGLFVEAEITGRQVEEAYVLPRYALRGSDTVYVVAADQTLVTRQVEILKTDSKQAVLSGGLEPGEQVATSPIAYFVEGMPVEIINTQ